MWKKITASLAAACLVGAALLPPLTAHAETLLRKGDTVQYTFIVGECPNIAGISVDSYYNTELLTLSGDPIFLIDGQGLTNMNEPGKIRWNTMITGGREFSNDDILVETFTVNKKCTLEDTALSFEVGEVFNHDLQFLPNELVTARIDILETGTDDDGPSDVDSDISDLPSKAESSRADNSSARSVSTVSIKPVTVSSTDLTPSDEEDIDPFPEKASSRNTVSRGTSSRTVSEPKTSSSTNSPANPKTSSVTSSDSSKSTSSLKQETQTTPQSAASMSKTSSAADSKTSSSSTSVGSKAAVTSTAVSSTKPQTGISTVGTAGRIAIAATAALFATAGVVLVLAKKLKTT